MTLVNPLDVKEVYRPKTIAEALVLLAQRDVVPHPLAGGTGLLAGTASGVEAVIDLSLLGLDSLHVDEEGLHLGATATLQDVADSPLVASWSNGLLARAARQAAPSVQRHQRTVGGTVVGGSSEDDLLVALLALDAQVTCYFPMERDEPHTCALETFLQEFRHQHPYLITDISIPGAYREARAHMERVSRAPRSKAIVNVAMSLQLEDKVISAARLVVGGVADVPLVLAPVASRLVGQSLDEVHGVDVEGWVREHVPAFTDWQAGGAYRQHVAGVLARRVLEHCKDLRPA